MKSFPFLSKASASHFKPVWFTSVYSFFIYNFKWKTIWVCNPDHFQIIMNNVLFHTPHKILSKKTIIIIVFL